MSLIRNLALALALAIACLAAHTANSSRELPIEVRLTAGLSGGGVADCWNALMELRSCTDEIVLFFINGESHLDHECCHAVRVITRHCWSSMLTSIGFTAQEGDILRGYCDAPTNPPAAAPTTNEGARV